MASITFQSRRVGSRQTPSFYEPLLEVFCCVIWGIQNVPSNLNKNRNYLSNAYCVFTKLSKYLKCEISTTFIKLDVKGTHANIPNRHLASLIWVLWVAFLLLDSSGLRCCFPYWVKVIFFVTLLLVLSNPKTETMLESWWQFSKTPN